MEEEQGRHHRYDEELLEQLLPEILDRPLDQGGPVVGGDYLDARRQSVLDLGELLLDRFDDRQRVGALPDDDDPADHLSFAVELGDAAPEVRDDLHSGHVRSEEHTSELQSLMRISYAVFCLKKKNKPTI